MKSFQEVFSEAPEDGWCSDVPSVFPEALRLPFVEGVPSEPKVQRMSDWVNRHKDLYKNESVVLYHATGTSVPVLEEGLKPTSAARRRSFQSTPGYVYLAVTPERAQAFGDLGNGGRSRVYAVAVLVRHLKADKDQLANRRSVGEAVGDSLAESLVHAGGARVKGAIQAWAVREVAKAPHGKFEAIEVAQAMRAKQEATQVIEGASQAALPTPR